jgi:hypothetical protein
MCQLLTGTVYVYIYKLIAIILCWYTSNQSNLMGFCLWFCSFTRKPRDGFINGGKPARWHAGECIHTLVFRTVLKAKISTYVKPLIPLRIVNVLCSYSMSCSSRYERREHGLQCHLVAVIGISGHGSNNENSLNVKISYILGVVLS